MRTRWGNWLIVLLVVMGLVLLAGFVLTVFFGGRGMMGGWWNGDFWMPHMGGWIFGWLAMLLMMAVPAVLLALLVIGVVFLLRRGNSGPREQIPGTGRSCPN